MRIYLEIYLLATIPFMFAFPLSARCNSWPCFSAGTTEQASEPVARSKPWSGPVTQQQSRSDGRQVLLVFHSRKNKTSNAGWEKSFQTNEPEQSLPSWCCPKFGLGLYAEWQTVSPRASFHPQKLHSPRISSKAAICCPCFLFLGIFIFLVGHHKETWHMWHPCCYALTEEAQTFRSRCKLTTHPQHFPFSLLPVMSSVIRADHCLSSLYWFLWSSHRLSFLLHL